MKKQYTSKLREIVLRRNNQNLRARKEAAIKAEIVEEIEERAEMVKIQESKNKEAKKDDISIEPKFKK